jgi:hypothetical protein
MPALNFQKKFAPAVEAGTKCQTIRAERKDGRMPAKTGDTIALYTGMRTKACRKLADVECISVEMIRIARGDSGFIYVSVDLRPQSPMNVAQADGFADAIEMGEWFEKTHGLPFMGHLIRWRSPKYRSGEVKK